MQDSWMLKLVSETVMRNKIYVVSKYLPTRHLLNIKRMIVTLQWSNLANILTKYLLISCTENTVPFLVFLPQMHMSPNLSEALHKTKLRDILQNDWSVLFKNVEIMKDRDRLNYCSRLKETNDMWDPNAKCYLG